MNRVNWKAKNEWEFIVNFKILQQAFEKCNIKKHIEVTFLNCIKIKNILFLDREIVQGKILR